MAFRIMAAGILLALFSSLSACGEAKQEPERDMTPTGIMVPVATFQEVKPAIQGMQQDSYCWIGDSIYYSEWEKPKEASFPRYTIYRESVDGSSEKEAIDVQDARLIYALFTDGNGNLGFIAGEHADEECEYFLIREDLTGQEISRAPLELPGNPTYIRDGAMDPEGNVLLVTQGGKGYLLDAEGKSLGDTDLGMSQPEILNCGERGLYVYQIDMMLSGVMPLWKVDFASGTIRQQKDIQIADIQMEEYSVTALESQEGILLSGDNTLWLYDADTGEREMTLSWIAPEVNIKGSTASAIRFGDVLEDGSREMEILLAGWNVSVPEVARVTYIDQAYVPVRQTLVVGVSEYSMMEATVRRFNRSNTGYRVELKKYDTDTMLNDLIFNEEEMPDIIDINWVVPDVLVNKGLLEDLEPYFQKSEVVRREDILPAIWEAGWIGDREAGAVISFSLGTYWTTDPDFPTDGWNIAVFMALAQKNPDKKLLNTYTPVAVMNLYSNTVIDSFVDWEKGECSFDSPEFVDILEQIASLDYSVNGNTNQTVYKEEEERQKFLKQEYLLRSESFRSPYDYQKILPQYRDKAFNVGYPSGGEGPWYLMNAMQQFAIYSNSECKEGAWAFIEFLLSAEEQNWYGDSYQGFPVRQDAFEAYLDRPYSNTHNYLGENTGAGAEEIAYMVQHMHRGGSIRSSELWDIIWEEVPYLFEGNKSAREVADLIQSRARIYLEENK